VKGLNDGASYWWPLRLFQYAKHAAWLEDHRRVDNGGLASRALDLALGHGNSRVWAGHWQRGASGDKRQ
jgi:hypothetical protein